MKNLKLFFTVVFFVLIPLSCQAVGEVALSQKIEDASEIISKTGLGNVYLSLSTKGKRFYAGFKITPDGINQPALIGVHISDSTRVGWTFDKIISDLFIYNGLVSLVFDDGETFSLIDKTWKKAPIFLGRQAHIVYSDGFKHLVSCFPSSPAKADSHQGGCESRNPNWTVNFPWYELPPKVCGGLLHAVTWSHSGNQHIVIDIQTGKITARHQYTGQSFCERVEG